MRRALAILKYVPAVLWGLLLVAWVVSIFYRVKAEYYLGRRADDFTYYVRAEIDQGAIWLRYSNGEQIAWHFSWQMKRHRTSATNPLAPSWHRQLLGFVFWDNYVDKQFRFLYTSCPISLLLTALLPLSIGSFIRFRFPLWSYFGWTALVAAEVAYYSFERPVVFAPFL